uniref:Uncharacterized protein n=1 Tax=Setaria italica TaxID=4555 RepID=K3ZGJ2_SETIT
MPTVTRGRGRSQAEGAPRPGVCEAGGVGGAAVGLGEPRPRRIQAAASLAREPIRETGTIVGGSR